MIDYLDKPPQRYDHVFQKNSGSREMVEAADGEWVKFEDMDIYMFEGAQGIKQLLADLATVRGCLRGSQDELFKALARIRELESCPPTSGVPHAD